MSSITDPIAVGEWPNGGVIFEPERFEGKDVVLNVIHYQNDGEANPTKMEAAQNSDGYTTLIHVPIESWEGMQDACKDIAGARANARQWLDEWRGVRA